MGLRAKRCEQTFDEAEQTAAAHGLRLTNPSAGVYQLRSDRQGWIINLYPRRQGATGRIYHDPHHRGPFLPLPCDWTLLDVVLAAVAAERNGD